jgi:hypothetical protein
MIRNRVLRQDTIYDLQASSALADNKGRTIFPSVKAERSSLHMTRMESDSNGEEHFKGGYSQA